MTTRVFFILPFLGSLAFLIVAVDLAKMKG
jgi:hypothetical protein